MRACSSQELLAVPTALSFDSIYVTSRHHVTTYHGIHHVESAADRWLVGRFSFGSSASVNFSSRWRRAALSGGSADMSHRRILGAAEKPRTGGKRSLVKREGVAQWHNGQI